MRRPRAPTSLMLLPSPLARRSPTGWAMTPSQWCRRWRSASRSETALFGSSSHGGTSIATHVCGLAHCSGNRQSSPRLKAGPAHRRPSGARDARRGGGGSSACPLWGDRHAGARPGAVRRPESRRRETGFEDGRQCADRLAVEDLTSDGLDVGSRWPSSRRTTTTTDERQVRRPPGPPRTCSALNPPSWWRGRLGAELRSLGFCAASVELSGVDSNLPANHPGDAGSRSAARRHVGEGSAHDPENLGCPTIDIASHVH